MEDGRCEESTFPLPRRAHHITSHTHPVSSHPPSFFDFILALSLQNPARGSSITLQSTNTFPINSQQATRSFQYFITTTNWTKGPSLALSPDSIFEPLTTNLLIPLKSTPYSINCLCCRRLLSTALRYTPAAARHQGNSPVGF